MLVDRDKRLITVTTHDPRELGQLLTARLGLSAVVAQRLLAEGAVFVGKKRAQPPYRPLVPGVRITVYSAVKKAAPTAALPIVFSDEDVLVLNKPAGLNTQPGRRGGPSLQLMLPTGATPLHRLDAEASGLVLCARNANATAALQRALTAGAITREYAAVVRGTPPDSGRIDLRIGPRADSLPMSALRQCYPHSSPHGQEATTLFQVVARQPIGTDRPEALLLVELLSGRTHQIRVHLAALGLPIVGDAAYGDGAPAPGRLLLHALRLRFRHPRTGKPCVVVAPPPPEFGWPAEVVPVANAAV